MLVIHGAPLGSLCQAVDYLGGVAAGGDEWDCCSNPDNNKTFCIQRGFVVGCAGCVTSPGTMANVSLKILRVEISTNYIFVHILLNTYFEWCTSIIVTYCYLFVNCFVVIISFNFMLVIHA